jgi:2-C-methyl-D-erythritol 2,4-cyclodiphosphate synthase
MSIRIGFGIDFHQLVKGRKFVLGGVEIAHTKGSLGHSDADVLLHAICDALLGAACLGDIGTHFPDSSQEFKDIDSKILLGKAIILISQAGFHLGNIDSTICLEEPKIKKYIPEMQKVIASILSVQESDISIKATTTEKMGFIGREEGVAAFATVLILKEDN